MGSIRVKKENFPGYTHWLTIWQSQVTKEHVASQPDPRPQNATSQISG